MAAASTAAASTAVLLSPLPFACCSMRADLKVVTGPFFFFYLNRYLWLKLLALFFVFFLRAARFSTTAL